MSNSYQIGALDVAATAAHKVWTRIMPAVFVLFVINYVDRVNIGFASLTMSKELGITSQQYGMIAGIFFLGYIVFEVPSNLLLHRFGARVWMARILISWGIVAILTGFAKLVLHLYALRFLLGVAEAGYYPGIVFYLTYWFPQRNLARAMAVLNTGNPVATVVAAPISGMLLDRAHWLGLSSWRWMLILEGVPAVVAGILTFVFLPDGPDNAKFLSVEEKQWLSSQLHCEQSQKAAEYGTGTRKGLADRRVWQLIAVHFFQLVGMNSVLFWMPQVMKAAFSHYSNSVIGFVIALPYVAGVCLMILVGRSSDRRLERRFHAAVPQLIAATALLLLAVEVTSPGWAVILLWCFAVMGIWSYFGPFWSIPSKFLTGASAAVGIALINSMANIGGFVGPYAVGAITRKTGSFHGGLVLAGVSLMISAALLLMVQTQPQKEEQPA